VVDDEPLVSRAIGRLLAGDEVVTSQSGRDALERLGRGERFDAILCDLMMPGLSGMDLHAEVVALDPAQARRFVFITGGAFTEAAQAFLAGTSCPSLEKPIDRAALLEALGKLRP
jgi:CheY-like chemotaxis protein